MKLKQAVTAAIIGTICAATLCGCDITDLATENLLRPPKTMGNEAAIEQLIADSSNNKYTLKYPKSGSYRSAITMYDLDCDGTEEAVAFCRVGDDIARLHMLVMYSDSGEWKLSSDNITETTDIDCIDFADVNGDGTLEILAGFTTYTSSINILTCYSYLDGKTQAITSGQNYSSFYCGDFNSDDDCEIITFLLYTAENEAAASMIDYNEDKNSLYTKATVAMDPNVVKYTNITITSFDGVNGIVVDGSFSNEELTTQIIYYNTELSLLRNPLYRDKTENFTRRSLYILSADIDKDSELEVPAVKKLPYPKGGSAENTADKIEWYGFSAEDEKTSLKCTMIADKNHNFALTVPKIWGGNAVTAVYGSDGASIEFYEWGTTKLGSKLFEIRSFATSDWDMGTDSEDYVLISRNDTSAYALKNENTDSVYALSDDEIKTAFTLLSEASI